MLYLETSAVVKVLVQEAGSELAHELVETTEVATSLVTLPEARAALAAARRLGRISGREHDRAKHALAQMWASMEIVELHPETAELAGDLAERHALRGFDAIHLASAVRTPDPILATWDADLIRAAGSAGIPVVTG